MLFHVVFFILLILARPFAAAVFLLRSAFPFMLAALTAAEDGSFLPRTIPFTSGFKFPARAMEHAEAEKFKKIPYLLLKSS